MWDLIKTEKILVALLPLFFSSNFTYTYEQSTYNGHLFTLRTRALNSLLFCTSPSQHWPAVQV